MKTLRATSALATQLSTTTCTRRPAIAASLASQTKSPSPTSTQHRTFLSNPFASSVQTLTATRILPYPNPVLYEIISDVSSYQHFLPFCRSSKITKYSNPDSDGKRWPEEGRLTVGFNNDVSESFHSRIYCVPGSVIEAVSGETETSILSADKIAHHNPRPEDHSQDPARNAQVLTHLLTRWTLRPFPFKPGPLSVGQNPQEQSAAHPAREQTEVNLAIEYRFANPVYGALSAAAAPKVADKMIAAFETRVKAVLDGPSLGGS